MRRQLCFLKRPVFVRIVLGALLWGLIGFPDTPCAADDGPGTGLSEHAETKARLTGEIQRLQGDEALDEDNRRVAVALLKTALQDSNSGLEAEQRLLRLQRQLETASRELDSLRKTLSLMPETSAAEIPDDAEAEQLERQRDELERKLDQPESGLRARVSRWETELSERTERLETLGDELLEAEQQLKTSRDDREALPEADDSPVTAAQRLAIRSAIQRWEQHVAALEMERTWLESTEADHWIRVMQEIAQREVELTESELQQVEERLDVQRRREAAARVEQAQRESQSMPEALKPLARENQALAERSRKLTERLEAVEDERSRAEAALETLETDSAEMQEMIENIGRNNAIGLMLRRQASQLPDRNALKQRIAAREEEVRELKLRQFEIDRLTQQSPDWDSVLSSVRAAAGSAQSGIDEPALQKQAETLLDHRSELLAQLREDYARLFQQLLGLVQTERRLLTQAQATSEFHGEQMLWLRTSSVYTLQDLKQCGFAVHWLADARAWGELPSAFAQDALSRPMIYLLSALAAGVLLLAGRQGGAARLQLEDHSLSAVVGTAAKTALRSAFLPALLAFAAWRINQFDTDSTWRQGIAHGLWRCAALAWPLLCLRFASAARGLGPVHWGWPPDAGRHIVRHVAWFLPVGLALQFVIGATTRHGNEVISDSLGRSAFVLLMVLGGLFCLGIAPRRTTIDEAGSKSSWPGRALQFLIGCVPLIPWGVALLAILGYYDTALKLGWRIEETAWLWLILSGLSSAAKRGIDIEQARLESLPLASSGTAVAPRTAPRKSLFVRIRDSQAVQSPAPAQISRQMRGLLQTGIAVTAIVAIGSLWHDVLPSHGLFDRWPLWQAAVTQNVLEPGSSTLQSVTRLKPVTIFDLGLAVAILGVTLVAARNVPGLVELLCFDRLPLDVGGRFAVTILLRYVLFVAGAITACQQIHVGWANVQWLVAAASVGLGFGLQDIFANFVSGIILLFERPIRVGDVITIGDTTGSVSQIRFRSTTIIDADRKELVVPNKDLITGKLLNWTLSDQTNRLKIRVAVNYQSDPNRVRQLLQEIALGHSMVLKDPTPTATFEEFGPNSLIFMLCAFLPSLDDRSQVLHELHSTIHARLQAEGLSITAPAPSGPPKNVAA